MRARCFNPRHSDYKYYGGRGIKVCERWASFVNFLADMGEVPTGLSIHRIDNDGNYEPTNCKWATAKEQASNKRGNFHLGHTLSQGESAAAAKLNAHQVREIRQLRGTESQSDTAARFGVSQSCVSSIQCGATWRSVE